MTVTKLCEEITAAQSDAFSIVTEVVSKVR